MWNYMSEENTNSGVRNLFPGCLMPALRLAPFVHVEQAEENYEGDVAVTSAHC